MTKCVYRTGCETPNDCREHGYCRSPRNAAPQVVENAPAGPAVAASSPPTPSQPLTMPAIGVALDALKYALKVAEDEEWNIGERLMPEGDKRAHVGLIAVRKLRAAIGALESFSPSAEGSIDERTAIRLGAISTASIMNTRESAKEHRIGRDNPYWTVAYEDVCKAVEREMEQRERAEKAESALQSAIPDMTERDYRTLTFLEAANLVLEIREQEVMSKYASQAERRAVRNALYRTAEAIRNLAPSDSGAK